MSNEPKYRIYVACLAAYNAGYLHGRWIDVAQGIEHIWSEIRQMLAESPVPGAEEHEIHDLDGFGGLNIGDIETVCEMAELIEEHGEELVVGLYNYYGSLEDAKEAIEDRYRGEYDSEVEYATELFDECYAHDIPENLRFYIDYEKFARDLFINDYVSIDSRSGVHVLSCY